MTIRPAAHVHDLTPYAHSHAYADEGQQERERALTWVTLLTLVTMAVELGVGWWTGSLALTADGWHMGTHALALGGAVLAYRLSLRADARRGSGAGAAVEPGASAGFAFGGWKIEVLAAYTSGLVLLSVALWLAWEGIATLRNPHPVQYGEALVVAVVGLVVNLASVWLLARGSRAGAAAHAHGHGHTGAGHAGNAGAGARGHDHGHDHDHDHGHDHHDQGDDHDRADGPVHGTNGTHAARGRAEPQGHHTHHGAGGHLAHAGHGHDHNFSAAYLHVLADAFTSLLAIGALAGGAWFGLGWLDPVVALLGAAVIGQWSFSVLRTTARALVDATEDPALAQRIRHLVESDGDAKVSDLHVWQVGARAWSAALAVVADAPLPPAVYRERLAAVEALRHVTVEVHCCPGPRRTG